MMQKDTAQCIPSRGKHRPVLFPVRASVLRVAAAAVLWIVVGGRRPALAGKVVLKIQAGNPIETPQSLQIKSNLPAGITTNDILSLGGLELGYDVKNGQYYVHKDIDLGPKEIAIFNVELDDVWMTPPEQLAQLEEKAGMLLGKLEGKQYYEGASALVAEVQKNLAAVREAQTANAIQPGVTAIRHIRAHEKNLEILDKVRKDVGRLENLVLATDQDPGELIGEDRRAPKPDRTMEMAPEEYRAARIRITVRNSSSAFSRTFDLKRDLPKEVQAHDVLDSGELQVGTDAERGVCYVYGEVALEPSETKTFTLTIRDKWNVSGPRVGRLTAMAQELGDRVTGRQKYESIRQTLTELGEELGAIASEAGPQALNEDYVLFHRNQADRLDVLEQKLIRIEAALRPIDPTSRWGFRVKPPSEKTTWMIIYIILGFLTLLSLVFFFRWIGRGKAESPSAEG